MADEQQASAPGLVARLFWWLPIGRVPELPAVEVARRLASPEPPQLLDVRTAAEWRRGRIADSTNVPLAELPGRLPTLGLDPQRPVVVICLSAHRSIPAVRLLRARGFRDVAQLAGGMLAWRREKLPEASGE